MTNRRRLSVLLILAALGCSRGEPASKSPSATPGADSQSTRPATLVTINVPSDSALDSATDLELTSIDARLVAPDGTPTSPNLIDNASANLRNQGPFRIKFSVTVRWRPQATRAARLDFWVRENGKEVFAQSGDVALRADSNALRADFVFNDGGCDDMVIFAFVWVRDPRDARGQPPAAEVYRYIPFDCGE